MHVHFTELSLAELLNDPLVQFLTASDGVNDTALRSLIQTIRHARRVGREDDIGHTDPRPADATFKTLQAVARNPRSDPRCRSRAGRASR